MSTPSTCRPGKHVLLAPSIFTTYCTCDLTRDPLEEPRMSLFQAIVDSISNPQHAGSNSDLQGLLNLAQLIPGVQDTEQHVKPILDVLGIPDFLERA